MNEDEIKEARGIAKLLFAWAEGQQLQCASCKGKWVDYTGLYKPNIASTREWRIKPEPRTWWLVIDIKTGKCIDALDRLPENRNQEHEYVKTQEIYKVGK